MPKARYDIMCRYMPTRGSLGLHMMHATGTVQANFDYQNEQDMVAKLRTATQITPIVTAIFANSAFAEGKEMRSRRVRRWSPTCRQSSAAKGSRRIARRGPSAEYAGRPTTEWAKELLDISGRGLRAIADRGETAPEEDGFLEPLQETVEHGTSPPRSWLPASEASGRARWSA